MGCLKALFKPYKETNGVWQDDLMYLHLRPQKAQELFNEFQKDGYLSEKGIQQILKKMQIDISESNLNKILQYTDVNHDNKYSLEEFKQLFYAVLNADPDDSIIYVLFFCYDKDESGNIDMQEFKQLCQSYNVKFTDEEIKEIFKSDDQEEPKVLYIREFREIIEKKLQQK